MSDETNGEQELSGNDVTSIEERVAKNFSSVQQPAAAGFQEERLKEMEKRLPSWSLEPPASFLG